MKLTMPGKFLLPAILSLILCSELVAQEATGFRVTALTSAERDSITQQLSTHDLQLVYACVPAGILVFSSARPGTSRATLRSRIVGTLSEFIAPARIGPADLNLQAAEAACQTARGE